MTSSVKSPPYPFTHSTQGEKMKSHKFVLTLVSLLVALTMLLAACAPAATPSAEPVAEQPPVEVPAKAVKVTYWHSMSNPETAQLEKVIAAFEEANPGINVEATRYASDDNSFRTAMVIAISSKTFPDAARMDIAWVSEYAAEGLLLQLDGNMPGFDAIAQEVFPGPLSTNYYNGHYYGLPLNTNTQVLLWNKGVFENAGIDVAPKTMAEFADVACKLSDADNESYGYALGGTYFWAPAPIFYAMGGKIVDDNITTASGYVNGPESVAAFAMLKELYDNGCISPNLLGGGIATDAGHGEGRYAMIIDGPWMVDKYKQMYPDFEVNFALIPSGPNGSSSVVGGEDVVIFNSAQDKDATMKWVAYLMSPEAQRMMAEVGVMPTLSSLQDDPAMPSYFGIFMEQLATAQARVPHPTWPQMDDAINQAFQRILLNEQNVQESLDQAADEINALLK
jgi:multiple sugar transport system substrate-binding protein